MRDQFNYGSEKPGQAGGEGTPRAIQRLDEAKLRPHLQRLQRAQKDARTRALMALAVALVSGIGGALLSGQAGHDKTPPSAFVMFLICGGCIFYVVKRYRGFSAEFKTSVMQPAFQSCFPDLKYRPSRGIPRTVFQRARLHTGYDRYRSEDMFAGTIDGSPVRFAEVRTYERRTRYRDGRRRVDYHQTFHGIFLQFQSKVTHSGTTVILPDTAESILGSMGKFFQRLNSAIGSEADKTHMQIEHPEFEKTYSVYSDCPEEAARLLTPQVAAKLIAVNRRYHKIVPFSLTGDLFNVGLQTGQDFMEVGLFESVNQRLIRDKIREIEGFLGLAAELKEALEAAESVDQHEYSVAM